MNTIEPGQFGTPEPRWYMTFLDRRKQVRLTDLVEVGLTVPATHGPALKVGFEAGKIEVAREGTGWQRIAVKSSFGAVSNLLYEDGVVSGWLKLRR